MDNHQSSYRSERRPQQQQQNQRPFNQGFNQGQYSRQLTQLPKPSGSMPQQRPMGDGFRGSQQPFYESNNPYGTGRSFLPQQTYQQRQPFVPYQGNANQTQQYRPFQQNQQPTRPPLQIANEANANQSNQYPSQRTYGNQNQASSNQANQGGNNFNRNPSNFNRNPFRKPFLPSTRAYHAEGQENTQSHDEQEEYDRYEDTFYQGAAWASESTDGFHTQANNQSDEAFNEQAFTEQTAVEEEYQDSIEAHFITPPPAEKKAKPSPKCRLYDKSFSSNNLLHKHLPYCKQPSKATATQAKPSPPKKAPSNIEAFSIQVIESTAKDKPTPERAFRGFRFATVKVSFKCQGKSYKFCFDTGCTISLIDKAFLN